MMNKSDNNENIGPEFIQAYTDFHKGVGSMVPFDSTNPFFKSRYTSLKGVIDYIKTHALAYGLSFMQLPVSEFDAVGVETFIFHTSGQYISRVMTVPFPESIRKQDRSGEIILVSRNVQQEAGGAITYIRRYALAAAFGLYADEDIDGNHPDQINAGATVPYKAPVPEPETPRDPDFPEQGLYVAPEVAAPAPKVKTSAVRSSSESSLALSKSTAEHIRRIHPTVREGAQFGYALRETLDAMNFTKPATEKQISFLEMLMVKLIPDEYIRHEVRWDILRVNDFKLDPGLAHPRIAAFLKWLAPTAVETGELTSTGKKRINYTFSPEVLDAMAMASEPYKTL